MVALDRINHVVKNLDHIARGDVEVVETTEWTSMLDIHQTRQPVNDKAI
ncbi:hypothetical protein [Pseudobacteriovorax antillogorgiicola]|nr:hypothetical protein [Pseudobacteriovorax antillogorgiicola]